MSTKTGDRAAGGCLALFALPFAAVGLGALYFALDDVWTWARMSRWEAIRVTRPSGLLGPRACCGRS